LQLTLATANTGSVLFAVQWDFRQMVSRSRTLSPKPGVDEPLRRSLSRILGSSGSDFGLGGGLPNIAHELPENVMSSAGGLAGETLRTVRGPWFGVGGSSTSWLVSRCVWAPLVLDLRGYRPAARSRARIKLGGIDDVTSFERHAADRRPNRDSDRRLGEQPPGRPPGTTRATAHECRARRRRRDTHQLRDGILRPAPSFPERTVGGETVRPFVARA